MSYNIDHIKNLKCDLHIARRDLLKLMGEVENLPEVNFLMDDLDKYLDDNPKAEKIPVKTISWSGECSGYTYDNLVEALSRFKGTAELVLFWEGGDSTTGLRVKDGKVIECNVKLLLEEKGDEE